ncbi:preprotein translocase subunit SecA [candidate division WOR-1 bacterium RIFOXYA12_FULL_43_27]|uniref:Protein translocase subunit SecA n=1 Tax=candidate division WOR-1 bacterium RIFOXYC2_FULL_46_14 TaxID=1802587 RepID=A0A1F4U855_UNCSA|nr:MAG: preprotein translocase subunit SecA [candidate division WOR-1 bacterium RIFOXYA12_FULL_43_27]OGC20029.1 MAG: preprotein translocase subunit SecA [candidate division WOR-1 bacterium RIFOXYB2_FULL_46_45]OGC32234.1 MAG: preprotein translocase subunit SecA [candidate division WOR-1 bacterium RIFOXYA2_FULL_46_56]OGC41138.1 MAG: preprotein translocase subunit SecA [candidate division WOR-1 bacterium RIFOXYC2_FULL_46_14]
MIKWLFSLLGDSDEKKLKQLAPLISQINRLEPELKKLSDDQLRSKTFAFKEALKQEKTLAELLPEAFAVVREASVRTIGLRHFDVQLLGGITLHQGRISEMKTGEGKTLVATLPIYLNALEEKGAHLVTVNDYLARRDAEWMGPIYRFLGLEVGVIQHDMEPRERRIAYAADITYGTNNEFGFDYLRDNMAFTLDTCVQRGLHYAIVDEVDSILIDEARTPLIISGMVEDKVDTYLQAMNLARRLDKEADFTMDEKTKNAILTEAGIKKTEELLNLEYLFDVKNMSIAHQVIQSLKALHLFKRDVDYVIKEGEIIIVDEFTGRLMVGRRYSDGLHQAIEAKERLKIQEESQTLATITFQNYFRLYKKLSGMTGTAKTEEGEFWKIYGLEVLVVPPNQKMIRNDLSDVIYKSTKEKFKAVADEIENRHKTGQPILVGTVSIEHSEHLADILFHRGVPHQVLNAKQHEKEAEIVAQAGQKGRVTISTNMAGRGTDIVLGEGVVDLGGLHVIGTERHESRRIDNQLRGRSGRQGDPGSSRFYVSLEDDLMRLFGSDRIAGMMGRLGIEENTPIEHPWISRALENAQKKVEQYHFSIRKQILEFDDVMNKQRDAIYSLRRQILEGRDLKAKIEEMAATVNPEGVDQFKSLYEKREAEIGSVIMRDLERIVMLRVIDQKWIEQLDLMEVLKDGIGLRGYGGKDPLVEYKMEGYNLFQEMMDNIRAEVCDMILKVKVTHEDEEYIPRPKITSYGASDQSAPKPAQNTENKVGRNDPCPCGSGKKYKKCCMNKSKN